MNLQIPDDCELRRVKISPFAKITAIPYELLQSSFNYGKTARGGNQFDFGPYVYVWKAKG
jgi:hypothetical protein